MGVATQDTANDGETAYDRMRDESRAGVALCSEGYDCTVHHDEQKVVIPNAGLYHPKHVYEIVDRHATDFTIEVPDADTMVAKTTE